MIDWSLIPHPLEKSKNPTVLVKLSEWKTKGKKNPTFLEWIKYFNGLKTKNCVSDSNLFLIKYSRKKEVSQENAESALFIGENVSREKAVFTSSNKLPLALECCTDYCTYFI